MIRQITIQPEAIDEGNEAFNWYEDRQTGLGIEFYRELTRCLDFIVQKIRCWRALFIVDSANESWNVFLIWSFTE
jgi:hypothetical protein